MNVKFSGKIVVTGNSSNIGIAVAKSFLATDAAGVVAVFCRKEVPPEFDDHAEKFDSRVAIVQGDVDYELTARHFTASAFVRFGRVYVVISTAAVSSVNPLHEHTSDGWGYVFNSYVKALFGTASRVIPVIKYQQQRFILMCGSLQAHSDIPTQGASAWSKVRCVKRLVRWHSNMRTTGFASARSRVEQPILRSFIARRRHREIGKLMGTCCSEITRSVVRQTPTKLLLL